MSSRSLRGRHGRFGISSSDTDTTLIDRLIK
jgi:hypothetical protein